jgi:SAM-dependent methyltransferase
VTRRGPDRDAASVGRTAHDLIFPEVNGAGRSPGANPQSSRCRWATGSRTTTGRRTGWDRGTPSPWLDACVREGALAPCRILVPGCGRGHEVAALARSGFAVTGVDFAPAAVTAVRSRLAEEGLAALIVEGDVFALEPDGKFAAVYEQTCLCALPPARWEEYEALLARWLEPGGGVTACGISTLEQGLVDQFLPFFTNWHWRGPAEVELKRDARDGVFKVIEINPRFPGYLRLPSVCGIELAVLAARSVVGDEPTRVVRPAGWRRFLGKNADVVGGLVTEKSEGRAANAARTRSRK